VGLDESVTQVVDTTLSSKPNTAKKLKNILKVKKYFLSAGHGGTPL
jgi:N-acetylmuramoyl-L-alanine amidase